MGGAMQAARAALVMCAIAAAVPARAQVQRTYDLAAAFLADPGLETAVWQVMRSEGPTGELTPLEWYREDIGDFVEGAPAVPGTPTGVKGYVGTESCNMHACFPFVAVNTNSTPFPVKSSDLVIPPGAVWLHPANPEGDRNGNAAVGFRSPFTGWVSVDIALARIHWGTVTWQVDLDGAVLQAAQVLPPFTTGTFQVAQMKVKKGSLLTVRVDAFDGYGADSSTLAFTVVRVPGPEE